MAQALRQPVVVRDAVEVDVPDEALVPERIVLRRPRRHATCGRRRRRGALAVAGCLVSVALYVALTLSLAAPSVQLLVLAVPSAFLLAVANGSNDIANSVGTSVGCSALSLNAALVLGSGVEFAGALLMGGSVMGTISDGVVNGTRFQENPAEFPLVMLSVLIGAGASTLLATIYGLPISATHGIISGLVAVGMAAEGPSVVVVSALLKTVGAWVASPLAGMLAAFLLYLVR